MAFVRQATSFLECSTRCEYLNYMSTRLDSPLTAKYWLTTFDLPICAVLICWVVSAMAIGTNDARLAENPVQLRSSDSRQSVGGTGAVNAIDCNEDVNCEGRTDASFVSAGERARVAVDPRIPKESSYSILLARSDSTVLDKLRGLTGTGTTAESLTPSRISETCRSKPSSKSTMGKVHATMSICSTTTFR